MDAFDSVNGPTVALSVGSIIVLLVLQRFAPRVPGTLIVVAVGILLAAFTGLASLGVALIDPVPSGFPIPRLPDLALVADLIPGALAIAVMAFLESAAVARGIRRATEPPIDSNRELFATGAANVVGAFFTAMPAAGGFSQSAVNQAAGAKTQLSSLVTVVLAVLVALFFGPVLSLLPEATLAAMVFVAVAGLIDIPELIRWARISPRDFWIALAVALIGLSAGLLAAVAVGVVLTLILVLREINIPRLRIIGHRGSAMAIHLGQGLYTGNALENEREIIALATERPGVTAVVLDVERLDVVTVTVLEALEELDRELAQLDIRLHLARLPENAATIARHLPWYSGLEKDGRTHDSVEDGLTAASGRPS